VATNHLLLYIHLCQCQWPSVLGVGLLPQTYWDCGFKSRQGHGCLSLVSCVLSGRGLCVRQVTHPEQSYRMWCAYLSVIAKPR
jgi:hypothetical protein